MTDLEHMFKERQHDLRARLDQAGSAEEVIEAINDEFNALESRYSDGLSLPQARVALPMFEALRCSVESIWRV